MKSPRRIALTRDLIVKHGLSTEPPPQGSLFWTMWNATVASAQEALQTPFIQGIGAGTLDPVAYGGFNVSDAFYCFNGAPDYLTAAQNTADPTLQQFLLAKYNSYAKYNATFPKTWHVQDASSILPFQVCQQYAAYETKIASGTAPIYCLIVMLPCEYLWAWLAQQLSPPAPGNLYAPWVTSNLGADGAFAIGNFLDSYQQANPGAVDADLAVQIYAQAMAYEQQNFQAALAAQETAATPAD